jgi:hypothetical protein
MIYLAGYFYKAYIKKLLINKQNLLKSAAKLIIYRFKSFKYCLWESYLNKRNHIGILCVLAALIAGLIMTACSSAGSNPVNGPVISSLTPEHPDVYPVGNTRVTCVAAAKDGGALTYQWVANDGTITGTGQTITWEAPKTYGDFHIMCTVYDASGNKASQTATVTVLVRDPSKCCR